MPSIFEQKQKDSNQYKGIGFIKYLTKALYDEIGRNTPLFFSYTPTLCNLILLGVNEMLT